MLKSNLVHPDTILVPWEAAYEKDSVVYNAMHLYLLT